MMKCQKCGAEMENGAAFCPNCGTAVSGSAPAEPQPNPSAAGAAAGADAGTTAGSVPPVMPTVNPSAVSSQNPQKQKQLIIAAGCVVVAVVLLIILIASTRTSAKDAVKDYYKAIEKQSASKMLKCIPKDYLKELMDEYDMSKKEVKEAVADVLEEEDEDFDIKLTFKDKEKLDEDDDEIEELNDYYFDDGDFKEVKKGVKFEVKVKVTEDGDSDSETDDHIAYKYGGSWYCEEALYFVASAVIFAD